MSPFFPTVTAYAWTLELGSEGFAGWRRQTERSTRRLGQGVGWQRYGLCYQNNSTNGICPGSCTRVKYDLRPEDGEGGVDSDIPRQSNPHSGVEFVEGVAAPAVAGRSAGTWAHRQRLATAQRPTGRRASESARLFPLSLFAPSS
jgi:hypothetical protein